MICLEGLSVSSYKYLFLCFMFFLCLARMNGIRLLENLFAFYFISHIPITLFIDLQTVLPGYFYPEAVSAAQ